MFHRMIGQTASPTVCAHGSRADDPALLAAIGNFGKNFGQKAGGQPLRCPFVVGRPGVGHDRRLVERMLRESSAIVITIDKA
jgi:hypothetical protein